MENLSPEMRRFERKPYTRSVNFSLSIGNSKSTNDLSGRIIDISTAGFGIETDYPLAPGHTLWLNDGTIKAGTVRWAMRFNDRYRAGIELKDDRELFIEEGTERYRIRLDEETDRFISRLEQLEKRCQSSVKNEAILMEVKKIMDDMISFCKEFEERAGYNRDELKKIISRFHRDTNQILSKKLLYKKDEDMASGVSGGL